MALVSIPASTNDGYCVKASTVDWPHARDVSIGDSYTDGDVRDDSAVVANKVISGRTTTWTISRVFLQFDTSSITHVPNEGSFVITGFGNSTADLMAVKGSWSGNPDVGDIDSIEGWVSGVDNSSNVIRYSGEVSTWSTFGAGGNSIDISQQGLVDIAGLDEFNVVLIEHDYDLQNNEPSSSPPATGSVSGMWFADAGISSYKPTIKLRTQNNSIFTGVNF